MSFKKFLRILLFYNLYHYGWNSEIYLKTALSPYELCSINLVSILKFSYEEFGLKKTILTNIYLFLGFAILLTILDVLGLFIDNTLCLSFLRLTTFLLFLKKLEVFQYKDKHQILLFFYLVFSFVFHFNALLSLFFIIMYENMIAITSLKGGLY